MGFFDSGFGSMLGFGGAILERDWAKSDASEMRNWQEKMRSTQHQVEVEDLKKAGLNPVLSAGGGPGNITPATQQPRSTDVAGSTMKGAQTATQKAIAQKTQVEATFSKKLLAYLEAHPEMEDIIMGGKLANDSGLPAWMGSGVEGIRSIMDTFKKPVIPNKYKDGPRVDKPTPKGKPRYRGGHMIQLYPDRRK